MAKGRGYAYGNNGNNGNGYLNGNANSNGNGGPPKGKGSPPWAGGTKKKFATRAAAEARAEELGISGSHSMGNKYMPGSNHSEFTSVAHSNGAKDISSVGQPGTSEKSYGAMSFEIPDKGEDYEQFMMDLTRVVDHELVAVDNGGNTDLKDQATMFVDTSTSPPEMYLKGGTEGPVKLGQSKSANPSNFHVLTASGPNHMTGSLKMDDNDIEDVGSVETNDLTVESSGSVTLNNNDINVGKIATNGDLDVNSGDVNVTTGNLNLNGGNINSAGNASLDGRVTLTGSKRGKDGDLFLEKGNIDLERGDVNVRGGDVTGASTITATDKVNVGNRASSGTLAMHESDINNAGDITADKVEITDDPLKMNDNNIDGADTVAASTVDSDTVESDTVESTTVATEDIEVSGSLKLPKGPI